MLLNPSSLSQKCISSETEETLCDLPPGAHFPALSYVKTSSPRSERTVVREPPTNPCPMTASFLMLPFVICISWLSVFLPYYQIFFRILSQCQIPYWTTVLAMHSSGFQILQLNCPKNAQILKRNLSQDAYGNLFTDRKITVVYCLSHKSDYVGAEFQIKTENSTYTRKFDYGDFIVFPANRIHRVKSLKSGKRITLVGWYR